MHVAFVSPAWRRFSVTRLALSQRAHLVAELAARGITATCVIVADDENLDIAADHGFQTVEMGNEYLGAKVNAGFRRAGELGADFVAFVGSDDWMHSSLFEPLEAISDDEHPPIVTGHQITVCDLVGARLRVLGERGRFGVPPWLLPRWLLERAGFDVVDGKRRRGMEIGIVHRLELATRTWLFHDPHPLGRVGFKCDLNMTPYRLVAGSLGIGDEVYEPWRVLERAYPRSLVELARSTHEELVSEGALAAA